MLLENFLYLWNVRHGGVSLSKCMCRTCMQMTVIRMWLSIKPQATVYETKYTDMHNCNTESGSSHMVRLASPACMSCPVCMGARAHGSSSPCALQGVYTLRLHSHRHAHRCGHWRGRSRHKQWHWQMKPFCHPYCSSYWIGSPQVVSVLAVAFSLSSWWIVFELMNDARTRKIRAGSDLRHDVLYKYIYIDKFHSKAVYVGLARAHPSHIQVRYDKPLEVCVSLNCTVHDNYTSWSSCGRC